MTPEQVATVVADVLPNHVFRGHVLTMAPATGAIFSVIPPENATGNFTKIASAFPFASSSTTTPCCAGCGRVCRQMSASTHDRLPGTLHDRRGRPLHGCAIRREAL